MAYEGPHPIPVKSGGTGASTLTGVLTGNGTSAFTASAITQYNVLTGGGANLIVSVAPGTSGFALTSNGASAQPSFQAIPGGTMVALQSQTASSSASIVFSSTYVTNTYNTYKIVYYNIYPATDNTTLNMDFSTDNGSTYINANFLAGNLYNAYNSTTLTNANSTTTMPVASLQSNSTSNASISGYMDLYNLPTANFPVVIAQTGYFVSGGTLNETFFTATNTVSTTINAIKFSFSSGNIAQGTFVLYGIKES